MAIEHWITVDLSSHTGTVALFQSEAGGLTPKLIEEAVVSTEGHHSEQFLVALDPLLKKHGLKLSQLSRFVTTSGPGSFTGLRIAYASLKAFAMATKLPLEAITASEARANSWQSAHPETKNLKVVTKVSVNRYACATCENGKVLTEEMVATIPTPAPELTILIDENSLKDLGGKEIAGVYFYPMRANLLGLVFAMAKTRSTAQTAEELISFSPQYFGDTKYT